MSYADDVRAEILALASEVDVRYRRLGILLKEAREKELYRAWGYPTLAAFCEAEIGYQERKMRHLISIVEAFERAGVSNEEASQLGPSKAGIIASILTVENKDSLIAQARSMPVMQLRREVARASGRNVSEETPSPMTFMVFPSQRLVIEEAIRLAMIAADTEAKSVALSCMAQDFIGGHSHLDTGASAPPSPH
jgi:hypothetical protein